MKSPAFINSFTPGLPLRRARPTPTQPRPVSTPTTQQATCTQKGGDIAAATFAAITVALSTLPLNPGVPNPAIADVPQISPPSLVVRHDSQPTAPTTVAVIGVAKAPIHDYQMETRVTEPTIASTQVTEQSAQAAFLLDSAAEAARREFVLATRLITAVVLGVLVGIERRATRLNLGVRSITIITLSAALVSVVTTGSQATGVTLFPTLAAAPLLPVVGMGGMVGLGLYGAARMRPRKVREMVPMCVVVGLVVAMGGVCGAGLSLLTAAAYLGAISAMRVTERGKRKSVVREGDVAALGENDGRRRRVKRSKVGQVGRKVRDVVVDIEGKEIAL